LYTQRQPRSTADFDKAGAIALHLGVSLKPRRCFFKDLRSFFVWWFDDPGSASTGLRVAHPQPQRAGDKQDAD
jgi:hypothetical protein